MAPPRDPRSEVEETSPPISRRSFLKGASGVAAGAASVAGVVDAAGKERKEPGPAPVERLSGEVEIELALNGAKRDVVVEPRSTLLDTLRCHLDPPLTGAKSVCDAGTCGACTVLVDGKPRYACMMLAVEAVGREVRTVEGLAAADGTLSPVQQAFWEEDALMCGFCTPGFVMSVTACLEKDPEANEAQVRRACSGNLCRCGTYPHIFRAADKAGARMRGGGR